MPAICRDIDTLLTGHLCDVVITMMAVSTTGDSVSVYANKQGVACVGDPVAIHTILVGSACVVHPGQVINAGSPTVFVGGKAVGRVGDSADLGVMISGSGNVFADAGGGGGAPDSTLSDAVDVMLANPPVTQSGINLIVGA